MYDNHDMVHLTVIDHLSFLQYLFEVRQKLFEKEIDVFIFVFEMKIDF